MYWPKAFGSRAADATRHCACGYNFAYCGWCENGLRVLVGEVCACCGAKGRKRVNPESIGERLKRGTDCAGCGKRIGDGHAPVGRMDGASTRMWCMDCQDAF